MRRIRTLAGSGRLRTGDRDLGAVDYELVVWREPRGWKLADGRLSGDGHAVVSALHSDAQVMLDLETGEHVMIEVTQASLAGGQFVVCGPLPRGRPRRTPRRSPARVNAKQSGKPRIERRREAVLHSTSQAVETL